MSTPTPGSDRPDSGGLPDFGQAGPPDPSASEQSSPYGTLPPGPQPGASQGPYGAPAGGAPSGGAPAWGPAAGPAPGTDLAADLGASLTWMWKAFTANLAALLVPAVVYGLILLGCSIIPAIIQVLAMRNVDADAASGAAVLGILGLRLLGGLVTFIASLLWASGTYRVAAGALQGRRASIGMGFVGPFSIILTVFVVGILSGIGAVLCILPGIVVSVLLMFAASAAASGKTLGEALSESANLVTSHLGVCIVAFLILVVASMVSGVLVVGIFVASPLSALFLTALRQRLSGRQLPAPVRG